MASDAAGNVVVAIESGHLSANPQDGSGGGVFVRRLSPTGAPLGGEVQVNVFTAGGSTGSSAVFSATPPMTAAPRKSGSDSERPP